MLLFGVLYFSLLIQPIYPQLVSSGKYKVDINRIVECKEYPNSKLPSPLYARYDRYNRTQKVMNANYTLARYLDERFVADVFIQKWGDGGWKNNFNFKISDICRQFSLYIRGLWVDFLKHFGVKDPEKCPLKKGKFRMRNYIMPLHLVHENFVIGTFNVKFVVSRESVVHTCVIFYIDTIENVL